MSAVAQVLRGFFDDAALFPPARLPLPAAVTAHHAHRAAWYAPLVGAFVCAWPNVRELRSEPLRVSLTLPDGPLELAPALAECARLEPVQLTAVEIVLPADLTPHEALRMMDDLVPPEVTGYLEVAREDERLPQILDALAVTRYRVKFRTGGLEPEAHPTEWELADAIRAAVGRGVPFKCTAGLHHAVRHTDGRLEQHGFLNLLLAVDLARHGADVPALAAALASRSAEAIAHEVSRVAAAGRLDAARALMVGIGTCSISDPIADLVALDLLAENGA